MPTSQQPKDGERAVIEEIKRLNPDSVLDVGCGEGRWGDLLRHETETRLTGGVEVWREYINKFDLEYKYDILFHADISEIILQPDFLKAWKAVIFSDVIEHLTKMKGRSVLSKVREAGIPAFMIIPTGGNTEQDGAVYGNPYETHISFWNHQDVIAEGFELMHEGTNPNGLVTIGTYKGQWNDRQ